VKVAGQLHAPAALSPEEKRLIVFGWEAERAPEPVWAR
jgi:hypothetical protein